MTRLTDQQIDDHVIPAAARLVGAVRDDDRVAVDRLLAQLQLQLRADQATTARALAVVLAAAVPYDRSMGDLLAWRDPERRRLAAVGVNPEAAAILAAGSTIGGAGR